MTSHRPSGAWRLWPAVALAVVLVGAAGGVGAAPLLTSRVGSTPEPTVSTERRAYMAFREGLAAARAGQAAAATEALSRCHDLASDWPDPLAFEAYLHERQGRTAEAARLYREVLSLRPGDVVATHALAGLGESVTLTTEADFGKAYAAFRSALGRLLARRRELPTAEARRVVEDWPDWPEAHLLLGLCLDLARDRTSAIYHYQAVLTAEPEHRLAFQALVELGYFPPTDTDVATLEKLLVDLINDDRLRAGAKGLRVNEALATCARQHSAEMRDLQYFSHESPTPELQDVRSRFRLVSDGIPLALGENIARRYRVAGSETVLTREDLLHSHQELMTSPGHRHNILNTVYAYVGVGIAINDRGDYWITEMFMSK